jgi:hypothetical protein
MTGSITINLLIAIVVGMSLFLLSRSGCTTNGLRTSDFRLLTFDLYIGLPEYCEEYLYTYVVSLSLSREREWRGVRVAADTTKSKESTKMGVANLKKKSHRLLLFAIILARAFLRPMYFLNFTMFFMIHMIVKWNIFLLIV